jgi:hypothetical protein
VQGDTKTLQQLASCSQYSAGFLNTCLTGAADSSSLLKVLIAHMHALVHPFCMRTYPPPLAVHAQVMLPQVERLRITADKARGQLDAAMGAVVTAEASNPMVDPDALTSAGVVVPHVLVRGSEGTVLTHETAGGATDAAGAVAAAGGAGGASQLVAVPALKEREAMYKAEQAETGA